MEAALSPSDVLTETWRPAAGTAQAGDSWCGLDDCWSDGRKDLERGYYQVQRRLGVSFGGVLFSLLLTRNCKFPIIIGYDGKEKSNLKKDGRGRGWGSVQVLAAQSEELCSDPQHPRRKLGLAGQLV